MTDVLIAGAGPAGAVTAYLLARAGLQVALIDPANDADTSHTVGETLPGIATRLLTDLGLDGVLHQDGHLPCYGAISAWGDGIQTSDSIRDPHGHGWRLNRSGFDRRLRAIATQAGAQRIQARATDIVRGDPQTVHLSTGQSIQAQRIVDASGRSSTLVRRLGATRRRDISLVAVYGRFPASDSDTRTLVEATPDGWWYTALLPDSTRLFAYHTDSKPAAAMFRAPNEWLLRLKETQYVASLLIGDLILPLRAADASGACLTRFAAPTWIAAGDAALSFDPLSSQGIYTALYTGMKAAEAILANSETDEDYAHGLTKIRSAYQAHWRQAYNDEPRWPDHPFWAKRQGKITALGKFEE